MNLFNLLYVYVRHFYLNVMKMDLDLAIFYTKAVLVTIVMFIFVIIDSLLFYFLSNDVFGLNSNKAIIFPLISLLIIQTLFNKRKTQKLVNKYSGDIKKSISYLIIIFFLILFIVVGISANLSRPQQ